MLAVFRHNQKMIMEVVVNCNVPTCNRKHNIIFIDNKAIISVKGFFKKVCHWEKNVEKICGSACQNGFFCRSHRLLNMTRLFKKNVVEKIMMDPIEEIAEIQIIKNCTHDFCMNNWCFDIRNKTLNAVSAMRNRGSVFEINIM